MGKKCIVADCHCDTLLDAANGRRHLNKYSSIGHVDLLRMQEGGVRVQFFAAFISTIYKPNHSLWRALQLIDTFFSEIEACQGLVRPGLTMRQINKDLKEGNIIGLLGIEGGEALNGDLAVLRVLYRLGVRFVGLTWNHRNQIADGVGESLTGGGLTNFGRQVVREMNRLGMIIDLAHISEKGFWDVMNFSDRPVIVSHANCLSLHKHPRNLTDDQIKSLAENKGVLGLSFVPEFIGCNDVTIDDFLNHVDHVAGLVGTDVIALGSDFDGIDQTPKGLEDCRCFPRISSSLLERGYTEREISGIMGGNVLRLMEDVLKN